MNEGQQPSKLLVSGPNPAGLAILTTREILAAIPDPAVASR